jgi:hypothetical protein
MMRPALLVAACGLASAWDPKWNTKPSWYDEVKNGHAQHIIESTEKQSDDFPLDPTKLKVDNYNWAENNQRSQIDTTEGSVYFRRYIAQEVFAAQLGEYLGICVARARHLPWGSEEAHNWQDRLEDVSTQITETDVAKVQYLFEDQIGLQEIEFLNGAVVEGFQAKHGYEDIMFDIGKLFAFDIFINDPHNCRFCECTQSCECAGHMWTCKDGQNFNFIISPTHGVCGHTRAYTRLDITGPKGFKFRQFMQLAHTTATTTELSRQLAYVVGEMFGENLTMDRREAAEWILKGARSILGRLMELNQQVFGELAETSGLHQSFEFGLGERLRMVRIIIGEDKQDPSIVPTAPEVDDSVAGNHPDIASAIADVAEVQAEALEAAEKQAEDAEKVAEAEEQVAELKEEVAQAKEVAAVAKEAADKGDVAPEVDPSAAALLQKRSASKPALRPM